MLPIFEQIGQVVNDFSVELANAHQIVEDDRLNQALEGCQRGRPDGDSRRAGRV